MSLTMSIVPRYQDFFDGAIPPLEELLEGVSSEIVLGLLAIIDSELYLSENKRQSDLKILNFILRRQPSSVAKDFQNKYVRTYYANQDRNFQLFTRMHVADFMHWALNHFKLIEGIEDSTPEQEYRLLKAFLIFIELRHQTDQAAFETGRNEEGEFFYTRTWPMLGRQFVTNRLVDPINEMVRSICVLNFLRLQTEIQPYVDHFLKERGFDSIWRFIITMTNIIQLSWQKQEGEFERRFILIIEPAIKPFFDRLSINPEHYKETYLTDYKNYGGLKEKPLYSYSDGSYIVLNWDFFNNKLYEGMLFDFYKTSGINQNAKFKMFPDFKNYVAQHATEDFLFKRLLKRILHKKHTILQFDDTKSAGLPDAYYREGNRVILFEIKDAYFSAAALNQNSYKAIKQEIDTKFNNKGKGTGQFIKQLKKLSIAPFEQSPNYKNRNLVIYPVIIYTDQLFGLHGFNNYLDEEFRNCIISNQLEGEFKQIKPLIFMDIRFLINNLDLLHRSETSLFRMFESFYADRIRAFKKVKRSDELDLFFACFENFESVVSRKFKILSQRRERVIKEIFDTLDLTCGLQRA